MHVDHIWPKLLEQVLASPKADAKQDSIREIIGAHIVLDGSAEQFLQNPRRKLSPIYASAELLWYLSRTKSAEMICAYAPQYKQFCEDGDAYGAYGYRIKTNIATTTDGMIEEDQLEVAITLLKKRLTTKKCIVTLWRPCDLIHTHDGTHADIPCTLTWQFIARGEQLHMICSMRSQDLWRGFLYDCYVNTVIQRYVAASLGLTAGKYHMFVGSEHLYEKDAKKAEEAIARHHSQYWKDPEFPKYEQEPYHPSNNYWSENDLDASLRVEEKIRRDQLWSSGFFGDILQDALSCCAAKWQPIELDCIRSPGLRTAMERFLCKTT